MHEVMPWMLQNLGNWTWVLAVMLAVSVVDKLLTAISKFLATRTAIRSSDPQVRKDACRILEHLTRSRPARLRRTGKNL